MAHLSHLGAFLREQNIIDYSLLLGIYEWDARKVGHLRRGWRTRAAR